MLTRFAAELRELRSRAGSPTYRELARQAHYSSTTLADAAGGRRLPSLAVTMAYVRACGGDVAKWEDRWRATAADLEPHPPVEVEDNGTSDGRGPYVGLAAYGQEDVEWFSGRDRLVAALVERVARQRFVAVVGASGSGKSSLLRAGLLPAVSADGGRWQTLVITPGAHPLEECAVRLGGQLGLAAGQLVAEFGEHPRNFGLALRQLMASRPREAEFLLVVDQFEEVFTLCHDAREREQFITAMLDAVDAPDSRTRIVVGLRADFYTHCARHARLVQALQDAQLLVGPMSTDELVQVITQPAVRAGLMVEKTLVTTVVHDAAERPGALPFVSHALWETWRRRHGNGLFLTGYQAAGGVNGAIAQTADRLYGDLDERQQRTAREILLRLTALGEGTEDTRRRVPREELLDSPDRDSVAEVLDKLAVARLVTLDADRVEIAHEALIRGWPALRAWLTEDRETLRAHRQLTEATAEWERHEREEGLLYRGARLASWQDRSLDRLNDAERAFLVASRRAVQREHRLRRRRVRLTIGGLGSAVATVTVLAVIALVMAGQADRERAIAVGRQLVADARAQLQVDPELGLLLAREAYAATPNDDTEALLRQAIVDSHIRATLPVQRDSMGRPLAVTGVAFSGDGKHLAVTGGDYVLQVFDWDAGNVTQAPPRVSRNRSNARSPVFSPDGSRVAIAGDDTVATVWDWTSGGKPITPVVRELAWSVAYSPDGQWVASGGLHGTIRIRPAARNEQSRILRGHEGLVSGVAYSPDGKRLVSSGDDGTIRVWDLVNGGSPLVLRSAESRVATVTFSPDGRHLATAGDDGTVRIWDLTGTGTSTVLGNHDGRVDDVAYSADGDSIVSTGADGTVRIWNADQHATPVVLRGHHGAVLAAAFSPDGNTVVSAGADGTTKIWDVDEVEDVTVLRGHEGPVQSAVPSPDGRLVASGDQDGTVRLWDVTGDNAPAILSGRREPIVQVTFSPDGRHLAAVAEGGTVLVWNLTNHREPAQLRPARGVVLRVAFSPDSTRLAAASWSDSLWIWDIPETGPPDRAPSDRLAGGQGGLLNVAWSPDGHHVAAASDNDTVLVWDLRTRADPKLLRSHHGPIWAPALTFSPDGTRLASGGVDGTMHLWNINNTAEPTVLRGHHGVGGSVTFSPDGRLLTATGNNATVTIWKTDATSEPLTLDGFQSSVQAIAPLTNDQYVTAHDDGTIRIWRCHACGPITDILATADHRVTRELTPEERQTYLPTNP